MSTKWMSAFNLRPVVYEYFKMSESQFKEMIHLYLTENEIRGIDIEFYDDSETHQVGVLIAQAQESEVDDRLDDLLGSRYWDDCYSLTYVLGREFFGDSFDVANYVPSTLSQEDPMIEFYCLRR